MRRFLHRLAHWFGRTFGRVYANYEVVVRWKLGGVTEVSPGHRIYGMDYLVIEYRCRCCGRPMWIHGQYPPDRPWPIGPDDAIVFDEISVPLLD